MLRTPEAEEHAGTPPDCRRALAAAERPALREGARRPPRPVLTGPPGPVHPAPGLLRVAAAEEASKPPGPWPGRGKGKHPGARALGCRAAPRGRCRARGKGLEGALWSGGGRLRGPPGPWTLPGPLSAPGGGVAGPSRAPAPRHKQAPDAEPPGSAGGGGGTRGGPGRLVTPPCPGLAAQDLGRANPLTPGPPPGLRPPGSSGIPAPGLPGVLSGLLAPAPSPWGQSRPTPPHFREGAGAGSRNGSFARGRGFS